ncbi:hypothetical protein K458DRAFT_37644 [Lentithecium fluviatile CBS 122367]|uniref:Uncharacterized protein n=1 Tax=Lentithecium fluviatile CBS 122367 TaxID=1168545 RepID=A0A6G1J1N7_9PLEO|nr:hypothetical protein K458DRAFT_37644 [Lentithecium fluviatile CBS 122367]
MSSRWVSASICLPCPPLSIISARGSARTRLSGIALDQRGTMVWRERQSVSPASWRSAERLGAESRVSLLVWQFVATGACTKGEVCMGDSRGSRTRRSLHDKRKTDVLKGDWRRREGLVRSCRPPN